MKNVCIPVKEKKPQSSYVCRADPWWLLLAFTDTSPKEMLKLLKQTFKVTTSD